MAVTCDRQSGKLGGDHSAACTIVGGQLQAVPGGRGQVPDDDALLLGADVVGDDPPGGLRLLLVLNDVVVDGTATVRPAVQVKGDEGRVGCRE